MTNTKLLKVKMVLYGDDDFVKTLATLLEVTRQTASDKLNGRSKFDQSEIATLTKHYSLTADEIKEIFIDGDDNEFKSI